MCPKVFIVKMRGCVVLKHKMYSWAVYITQKKKEKKRMYHVCKSDEERDQECAFKRMEVKESVCSKIKYFKRVHVQTENSSGECTEA